MDRQVLKIHAVGAGKVGTVSIVQQELAVEEVLAELAVGVDMRMDDDGWRSSKFRWRRENDDDDNIPRLSSSSQRRRLHQSWSEEGCIDSTEDVLAYSGHK